MLGDSVPLFGSLKDRMLSETSVPKGLVSALPHVWVLTTVSHANVQASPTPSHTEPQRNTWVLVYGFFNLNR